MPNVDVLQSDQYYMQRAFDLSKNALPKCLPNPPVGCVLVQNNNIIGQGYTQPPYYQHAEAMALANIIKRALTPNNLTQQTHSTLPITAYVTLEPCAFEGKTPSCAKALITANIARVVIATLDPDPRNSGKGIALLENAGIHVELGVHQHKIRKFLSPFLLFS